ncbi:MAG: polyprenyl synthetase family protein [Deltaproteobacteria bacterium]|nr:MAG: polyprenyl synthetase family protein [Deltaproteobacteria bacterium]
MASTPQALPGGPARRARPAGVLGGAPLSRIAGPGEALGLVASELHEAESELRRLVMSEVAAVPAVAGYLVEAGGKRLRPALTALGARAVGDSAPIGKLMCVGELIHLGSLLHDDVVDDADTRRGLAATHTVYGSAVTVLTGDFCLARAVLLASVEGGHQAVTALGAAVTAMAEGEVLQLQRAGDLSCSLQQYTDVIQKKSAALIAWCAAAAAYRVGDADAAHALEIYGRGAGIAFQITDDVLDYRQGTGKTAGADLRERKVTLPLLHAMERIDGLREELEAGAPEDIPGLIARIQESGALDAALADARSQLDIAIEALHALPPSEGRDALEVLGHYLVERAQ